MTTKGTVLSFIALVLAAIYVTFFTDWFHRETIEIIPAIRPVRVPPNPQNPDQESVYPVSFAFNRKYKLTEVKVVAAADLATNKYPQLFWHLISDSNSVPTKSIVYGRSIKGMKLASPEARPKPLSPDVDYLLLLEAGSIKAQTNFHTARATEPGP